MKKIAILVAVFVIVGLTLGLALPAVTTTAARVASSVPFQTVDQGEISYFRYGDSGFAGADMLISDKWTWAWFWAEHTKGMTPPPPLPEINFGKEMVIVTILGYQTSGGGPSTKVIQVDVAKKSLNVLVEDNETPGPLDLVTNPFHIIKLRNVNVPSVVFEHQRP